MLFSSTSFIYLFLPITLFFYYVIFRKSRLLQNIFLLAASLFFYAWGEPTFVLVMMASILVNWFLGLMVDKYRANTKLAKGIIVVDVCLNLGLLFVFKYLNFAGSIFESIFKHDLGLPYIALPIGISFFTFQALSYVVDVYRGRGRVQKNILYVGLYIAFFPQLIAGPIVRYETVAEEIINRKETVDDFFDGFARFIVGLGKKVLLSNCFATIVTNSFGSSSPSVAFSWLGLIAYALQLFFDFCGYSDMAIGLGRMFGFHFLENFNYPYISTSLSEFWRRWHMSFASWIRDYVYFPLGGSRVSKPRLVWNLFVVWLLTGIWHGADYTYIAWGMLYFVLGMIEKFTGIEKKKGPVLNVFKWLYTMFFFLMGLVFVRSVSMNHAIRYMTSLFGGLGNSLVDGMFIGYLKQYGLMLVIGCVLSTPVFRILKEKFKGNVVVDIIRAVGLVGIFILCMGSLVSSSFNPFIYFNF